MKKLALSFLVISFLLLIFFPFRLKETKAAKESIFGVTHNKGLTSKIAASMSQAGIKWEREFFRWGKEKAAIEPEEGKWSFEFYDRRLDLLGSAGIQAYAVISRTPEWAEISHGPLPEGKCTLWGANYAPKSGPWRRFLRKIISRYGCGQRGKCQIRYWEIYWEENGDCHFLGKDSKPSFDDYLRILKIAHKEIKNIDPSAKIVLGRLLPESSISYLKRLLGRGGGEYFDVVSFGGPYGCNKNQQLEDKIREIREVLEEHGIDGKEIWATEALCTSDSNGDGQSDLKGEQIQAEQVKSWYQIAQDKGIQKVFWQSFQDRINFPKANKRFTGLVRDDLSPKPSYCAYKEMATGIPCISLSSGWDEITWPDISGYTAKTALGDIDRDCGEGTATTIAEKRKDWWEGYVKNFGGKNFNLQKDKNYFINVGKSCNWTP